MRFPGRTATAASKEKNAAPEKPGARLQMPGEDRLKQVSTAE